MSAVKRRGRPKGRKNSHPAPQPARAAAAVIEKSIAHANELKISIHELIARAYRCDPEPDLRPEQLLKRFMLTDVRVFLWAMEHDHGKPRQFVEASGPAGGPMELKVVIERIGEKNERE